MKSYDVAGCGYACIDFIGTVPHLPELDTKLDLGTLAIEGGGPVATALVALSRLGAKTLFVGKLGDDDFARKILDGLKAEHVAVEVRVAPGTTSPMAFVLVTPDGRRTIIWTRGTAPFLAAEEVEPDLIHGARVLILDDIEIAAGIRAARIAREAQIPVILGAGTPRAGIEQLIRLSDDVVLSEKFPFRFTGERDFRQALAGILAMGPRRATATLGARGCCHLDADGHWYEQPAFAVEAIDTTGAGDVFHGAYTFGRLNDWEMPRILRFAAAVAAMKTRRLGGRSGIPGLQEALAWMDSQSGQAVR